MDDHAMAIKFKLAEEMSGERAEQLVGALARHGFSARRLFPRQERRSLATIYVVGDAGDEKIEEIKHILDDAGGSLEFIEGSTERHPLGGTLKAS